MSIGSKLPSIQPAPTIVPDSASKPSQNGALHGIPVSLGMVSPRPQATVQVRDRQDDAKGRTVQQVPVQDAADAQNQLRDLLKAGVELGLDLAMNFARDMKGMSDIVWPAPFVNSLDWRQNDLEWRMAIRTRLQTMPLDALDALRTAVTTYIMDDDKRDIIGPLIDEAKQCVLANNSLASKPPLCPATDKSKCCLLI